MNNNLSNSATFINIFITVFIIIIIGLFLKKIFDLICILFEVLWNKSTLSYEQIKQEITEKKVLTKDEINDILTNAYSEYHTISNIITSKINFFLSSQVVVGSLFSYFLYKINKLNNLSFYYALIPTGISMFTYLLYGNILNAINKYRNIVIIIEHYEKIKQINLLKFYNNGFYKQTYTDYDFITLIAFFLIPSWLILGSYLIYHVINLYTIICLFALLFIIFSDIIINNKKYKLSKQLNI